MKLPEPTSNKDLILSLEKQKKLCEKGIKECEGGLKLAKDMNDLKGMKMSEENLTRLKDELMRVDEKLARLRKLKTA